MKDKFRLDRTAFKGSTAKEADDHVTEWKDKTPGEPLRQHGTLSIKCTVPRLKPSWTGLFFQKGKEMKNMFLLLILRK